MTHKKTLFWALRNNKNLRQHVHKKNESDSTLNDVKMGSGISQTQASKNFEYSKPYLDGPKSNLMSGNQSASSITMGGNVGTLGLHNLSFKKKPNKVKVKFY